MPETRCSLVVAGVSGTGKSTLAKALAARRALVVVEADDFHSRENRDAMRSGRPLGDDDRGPWLAAVGERLAEVEAGGAHAACACSALKRRYRDALRVFAPELFVVNLIGPYRVMRERLESRGPSLLPVSLLKSQYVDAEALGSDEVGVTLDATADVEELVACALEALDALRA